MRRDGWALAFAMVFPSIMTWIYFVALAGHPAEQGAIQLAAYGLGKVIQFSFPAVFVFVFYRQELRPGAPSRNGLLLGLAFGLCASALMFGVYCGWLRTSSLMAQTPELIYQKLTEFNVATPIGYLGLTVFIAVGHSLLEEYYWRWFVFGRLRRMVSLRNAILLSSLAFTAHHVIVLSVYFPGVFHFVTLVIPFALGVAVGGAVWAWLYERTQSFYAPWLSHLLIDAAIMAVGYDLVAARLV